MRWLLAIVVLLAGLGWYKRDDVRRLAAERAPALSAYLGPAPVEQAAAPPARPAVPIVIATASRKTLPVTVEAVGTVQSMASIAIKPRIDSQVARVLVEEGARVREGDLLFLLDARALKAQLAQAEAQITKDLAQIEQARRDLGRAEDLLAKKIGTQVQRDTATTLVKVQEAQLAADQAQRDNLAASVSYTEIRAPVSGRIGSIMGKNGTTVRAADATALVTVNQIDPVYVSFAVPQGLLGALREAMARGPVTVRARVGPAVSAGEVAFVENNVDLATGTVLAKAKVPNGAEKLWPGAFVSVEALLGEEANVVSVPTTAVQIGQQGAFVFAIANGRASLKPVTVARTVGAESVIERGLAAGEQVAVDGQLRLVDGAAVQIQAAPASRTGEGVAKSDVRGGSDQPAPGRG